MADDAEAGRIADLKEPGSSWINTVLNSGKVDEPRLLTHLGEKFRMPVRGRASTPRASTAPRWACSRAGS